MKIELGLWQMILYFILIKVESKGYFLRSKTWMIETGRSELIMWHLAVKYAATISQIGVATLASSRHSQSPDKTASSAQIGHSKIKV